MSHDPEEYREPFAIEWDWRKIALILLAKAACLGLVVAAYISLTMIAFSG